MNRRPGHDLRLDREAGSHADLSADAKRIDSLIAGRRLAARTDHLPVIPRSPPAAISQRGGPSPARPDRGAHRYFDRRRRRLRASATSAGAGADDLRRQPDPRTFPSGGDQVERAIVVEVGNGQPRRSGSAAREIPAMTRSRRWSNPRLPRDLTDGSPSIRAPGRLSCRRRRRPRPSRRPRRQHPSRLHS